MLGVGALGLALLVICFAYFKLDAATKGYLTPWLRLAAAGSVAAAAAVVLWFVA
jgi:hypothetical protein